MWLSFVFSPNGVTHSGFERTNLEDSFLDNQRPKHSFTILITLLVLIFGSRFLLKKQSIKVKVQSILVKMEIAHNLNPMILPNSALAKSVSGCV
jgi:hypothetical protein